jgi:hypothetical protein
VKNRTPAEEKRARELAKLDDDASQGLADMRLTFRRLLLGALGAVATAGLVVAVLEANKPRPGAPPPPKPVTVQILPLRP